MWVQFLLWYVHYIRYAVLDLNTKNGNSEFISLWALSYSYGVLEVDASCLLIYLSELYSCDCNAMV